MNSENQLLIALSAPRVSTARQPQRLSQPALWPGFTLRCCGAGAKLSISYRKPFLSISLSSAVRPRLPLRSLVCRLSRRRRKPLRKPLYKCPRKGKWVHKSKIYNRGIWPMGPRSSRCPRAGQCVPEELAKSCVPHTSSCAVPGSQNPTYPQSHGPRLPWATPTPGLSALSTSFT